MTAAPPSPTQPDEPPSFGWRLVALCALAVWLLLATSHGCAATFDPSLRPDRSPDAIGWRSNGDGDLAGPAASWRAEALRRWPGTDPFVFHAHGGYDRDGVWVCRPPGGRRRVPVEGVALLLTQLVGPGRPIVMAVCNERGATLSTPGVWYARTSVWQEANRDRPWRYSETRCQFVVAACSAEDLVEGGAASPSPAPGRSAGTAGTAR